MNRDEDAPRQRVVRARHGRRATLTPAPGTTGEPVSADEKRDASPAAGSEASGPNDDRLRRDRPPHY
ncbi:MAG: hypothetical protein ACK5IN_04455 [Microbacterium sp.]|uniref:hypothetical protein n=1 Tax=Microbacterium sp. TaxID=51671 RepID=UPI003A84B8EC